MEHDESFHVRPFPQQPHRGGKKLLTTLTTIEETLTADIPDLPRLRELQAEMHHEADHINDDALIDRLRQISKHLDTYCDSPSKEAFQKIAEHLLKARVDLKHL